MTRQSHCSLSDAFVEMRCDQEAAAFRQCQIACTGFSSGRASWPIFLQKYRPY